MKEKLKNTWNKIKIVYVILLHIIILTLIPFEIVSETNEFTNVYKVKFFDYEKTIMVKK